MTSKRGTRRKFTSEARSSREFWTTVPVIHHRIDAERFVTALNCCVVRFRINELKHVKRGDVSAG